MWLYKESRRAPHVKQELLILMEHPSSLTVFSGVRVSRSFVFYAVFSRSLFVLFSFLFLSLYVLLRFTASDYLLGIFKLFLRTCKIS